MQSPLNSTTKKVTQTFGSFSATGVFSINGKTPEEKTENFNKMFTLAEKKGNYTFNRMSISLKCGRDRLSFATLQGSFEANQEKGFLVHPKDDLMKYYFLDFDQRFNEEILETLSYNDYITVGLTRAVRADGSTYTVMKKFLCAYEAINEIYSHLEDGMILTIRGKFNYFINNEGKLVTTKTITHIYLAPDYVTEDKYSATFTERVLFDSESCKAPEEKGLYALQVYSNVRQKLPGTADYKVYTIPQTIYVSKEELPQWKRAADLYLNITSPTQIWVVDIVGHFSYVVETEDIDMSYILEHPEEFPQYKEVIRMATIGLFELPNLGKMVASNKSFEVKALSSFKLIDDAQGVKVLSIDKDKYTKSDLLMFDLSMISHTEPTVKPSNVDSAYAQEVASTFKRPAAFGAKPITQPTQTPAPAPRPTYQAPISTTPSIGEQEIDSDMAEFLAAMKSE